MPSQFKMTRTVLLVACWLMGSRINAQDDKPDAPKTPGMKIEVLAIGTHEEEPQRWWQADGQPLDDVPFTWTQKRRTSDGVDRVYRRIAFRIQNLPKGSSVYFSVRPDGNSQTGPRSEWASLMTDGKTLEDHYAKSFSISKDAKTMDLTVTIAKGDWRTAGSARAHGQSMFSVNALDLAVAFSELLQFKDETRVIVTHNCIDKEYRVVAVAKDGTNHPLKANSMCGGRDFHQCSFTLPDLPREQIKCFDFQIREYKEFKIVDLPLQPTR